MSLDLGTVESVSALGVTAGRPVRVITHDRSLLYVR